MNIQAIQRKMIGRKTSTSAGEGIITAVTRAKRAHGRFSIDMQSGSIEKVPNLLDLTVLLDSGENEYLKGIGITDELLDSMPEEK